MKKLLIVCCVVAASVYAQAASFNWQTSGKFVDATDKSTVLTSYETGTSIVLVYLGNSSADGWTLNWNNAVVTSSTGTIKSGTSKGKVGGSLSFTYGAEGAYSNGDVFGIMFQDADSNLSQLLYASDDSLVSTTYTISGMSNNTWIGSTTYNPASSNFYAVPEPTSGLLFIVGIAGLALKRKKA